MKTKIENTLKLKYKEDFNVIEHYFEKGLNLYQFKANPLKNKEIVFGGTFDERVVSEHNKISSDGFINSKYAYEASLFYKSLFSGKNLTHVAQASVYSRYEHTFGTTVPSWTDYLKKRENGSTIRNNTYFFTIPETPDDQLVKTLRAAIESLHDKYRNEYSIYVGFWPEGFLEDLNFDDLTFGFETTSMEDADNLLNVMQYLSKVFFVKIINGSIESLTHERIFELIKDHDKNNPEIMVEI
jgi:hypothetical protein